ncbi:MAG: response regulator [Elusimicrobia bacterium]|nr:response regulator [Elusimicrobiota bacterium]
MGHIREYVKIMIVEDEAIIAEDLSESLAELGYKTVGISTTAEDAIQKAEKLNPDLILMDIMLGGSKTGIDVAQEIKKKKEIAIIYITAYSSIDLVKKAEKTGPVAYIVKPIDKDELATCIGLTLMRKMKEMRLEEKKKELEKEKDPEKHRVLEREIKIISEQVENQKKENMIFFK